MSKFNIIFKISALLLLSSPTLIFSANPNTTHYNNSFDTSTHGQLPTGWIIDAPSSNDWFSSSSKSNKLSNWSVMRDKNSYSGKNVFSINKSGNGTYNISHTNNVSFLNGEIQVRVRANSGVVDQGGGPIWRVKDKDNYYVARYNPLEGNFRVYYVKNGTRITLESTENINIKKDEWFTIKISHNNNRIIGWLNGEKLLDVIDDTHKTAGGIGLWTKADALTSFDDISIKPL